MAIVLNKPADASFTGTNSADVASWIVGLAMVIVIMLGAMYLLPRLADRNMAPANINVTLPLNPVNNEGVGATPAGAVTQ